MSLEGVVDGVIMGIQDNTGAFGDIYLCFGIKDVFFVVRDLYQIEVSYRQVEKMFIRNILFFF